MELNIPYNDISHLTDPTTVHMRSDANPFTQTHACMKYRLYTLHPTVDDYFYHNYGRFNIKPLVQKIYYLTNIDKISSREFAIEISLTMTSSLTSDILIKLGQINPTSIKSISVRSNVLASNNYIYNMDWLTIFMYNSRHYPQFIKKNIFIIPNLVMIQSNLFNHIMEIRFNENKLMMHTFSPIRREVSNILEKFIKIDAIKNIIMQYLPDYLLIDIWHKTENSNNQLHATKYNMQIINMLRMAYKYIYMCNYILSIQEGCCEMILHKNIIKNEILFGIVNECYGTWSIIPGFKYLIITYGTKVINIFEHELIVSLALNATHYVKSSAQNYTIPTKFKLTENITISGQHSDMYHINMSDYFSRLLVMNNDEDDDDEFIYIKFVSDNIKKINNGNTYMYVEISVN